MEYGKIQELVAKKNKTLEDAMIGTANTLISNIVSYQKQIDDATKAIELCRKSLSALTFEQLDPDVILGR